MTTSPSQSTGRPTTGTTAASGPTTGIGDSDPPSTPQEAAAQFEKVLVRQFVKKMTEDMFSSSFAGEGGGNWMESQRDRQRDMMTDMITDRIVEADTLQVSESLANEWEDATSNADAADPSASTQEENPRATPPADATGSPRPLLDSPPATHNKSNIDRVV